MSSLMRNVPIEQRGVVIPETELAEEARWRGMDDAVPLATHKRERLPPVLVPPRFGEDICTIKSEDIGKDVVGKELIYSRQRRTVGNCSKWISTSSSFARKGQRALTLYPSPSTSAPLSNRWRRNRCPPFVLARFVQRVDTVH